MIFGTAYNIIGLGGHSKVVADIANRSENGFVYWQDAVTDFSLVVNRQNLIVAIGDNYKRSIVVESITDKRTRYATLIHPSAVIANGIEIGCGTVIMANTVVNAGCKIGKHCIINTGAILEHDSVMEDFSSLAPRVVTGGNVKIGYCSAIGIGAVISNKVQIGSHTIIGAGSLVLKDVENSVVAYGVPCKFIRTREKCEKYL